MFQSVFPETGSRNEFKAAVLKRIAPPPVKGNAYNIFATSSKDGETHRFSGMVTHFTKNYVHLKMFGIMGNHGDRPWRFDLYHWNDWVLAGRITPADDWFNTL